MMFLQGPATIMWLAFLFLSVRVMFRLLGRDRSTIRSTSPGKAVFREGQPVPAPAGYDTPSRLSRNNKQPRPA
jgi:hypothetical protein